jgi:hypothetical protein
MKTYRFIKTGENWYIDLPEYLEQGGSIGDLQMVEGADTMLDVMAENKDKVTLTIARELFQGADKLILTEKCDPLIGGGYYLMKEYEGKQINQIMWLCQVTEFVFGDIPPEIYIRKEN